MRHSRGPKGRKGQTISFRPRKDLRARLEKLAEQEERPLTWFIEQCIKGYIEELERRYGIKPPAPPPPPTPDNPNPGYFIEDRHHPKPKGDK